MSSHKLISSFSKSLIVWKPVIESPNVVNGELMLENHCNSVDNWEKVRKRMRKCVNKRLIRCQEKDMTNEI